MNNHAELKYYTCFLTKDAPLGPAQNVKTGLFGFRLFTLRAETFFFARLSSI
jgi:hypothetical protein